MAKTKYVAISSQKGGVGKTTTTILTASAFHYLGGVKVAVIDCDFPQQSIMDEREKEIGSLERELEELSSDGAGNAKRIEEIQATIAKAYPVVGCTVKDAVAHMDELDGKVDLVFVDTPGTMNVEGIVELWKKLDYIFIPVEPDKFTISSTISYIDTIEEVKEVTGAGRLKRIYTFWNKYVKSEKRVMYERTEQYFSDNDIPLLEARLEQSVNYRKDEMRSTLYPLKNQFMELGIRALVQEMSLIIFPQAAAE